MACCVVMNKRIAEVGMKDWRCCRVNIIGISNVANAYYIDPTTPPVLHSYFGNAFIHYNAASHRGGIDNSTAGPSWASGTAYTKAASFVEQTLVVASDNFIYSCIANTTGNDP